MMKNILFVCTAFVVSVLLNCALIWCGYLGFAIAQGIVVAAVGSIMMQDDTKQRLLGRALLAIALAFLYLYTIWFPEVWVTVLATIAIVTILWLIEDYEATKYVALLVAYFLAIDASYYIMGDPILEKVDAVLVVAMLACFGMWAYHTKTLKPC